MSAPISEIVLLALATFFWLRAAWRWWSPPGREEGLLPSLCGAALETAALAVFVLLGLGTAALATTVWAWATG